MPHSTPGGSFFIPPCDLSDISLDDIGSAPQPQTRPLDALNEYLRTRDISPIRSQLHIPWENYFSYIQSSGLQFTDSTEFMGWIISFSNYAGSNVAISYFL